MNTKDSIAASFITCLENADANSEPFRFWLLKDPLPEAVGRTVVELPIEPADIEGTQGRRETNNATRVHASRENLQTYPVFQDLAASFQDEAVIKAIEKACDIDLTGSYLRIEYCQDTAGFWLEPHTDIGVKVFTMLIYLSEGEDAANWGTDVLYPDGRHAARAPCGFNVGMIFIPGENTWHSYEERPINGVRRSLMVNFVSDKWRAREELSFPQQPVPAH